VGAAVYYVNAWRVSPWQFCVWLQRSATGQFMQNSLWPFPVAETIHIIGIVVLVGSVTILDLRLLGLTLMREPVSALAKRIMPWAWAGFSIQVVSGFLLFATEPEKLYGSVPFRLKLLMIVLVGVNALLFHGLVYRNVQSWDCAADTPLGAKVTGCFSILLWLGIITAGRWIAFY
jgi:hypothetical protein